MFGYFCRMGLKGFVEKRNNFITVVVCLSVLTMLSACFEKEVRDTQDKNVLPSGSTGSLGYPGYSNVHNTPYTGYYDEPLASDNYVFALNPNAGSVTVINAEFATVQVVETGLTPLFLKPVINQDAALVLNVDSNDATLVKVGEDGKAKAFTTNVVEGANSIDVSPDGKFAIVYFDAQRQDLSGEFGDFQTVSVLSLTSEKLVAHTISVGFKPRSIFFKSDNLKAYVVTDDGISIIDLENITTVGSGIASNVTFSSNNWAEEEKAFTITPDGKWAVLKKENTNVVQLLNIETGEETHLELTGFFRVDKYGKPDWEGFLQSGVNFGDIRFAPDGSTITLVEYNNKSVLQLPIPEGIQNPMLGILFQVDELYINNIVQVPQTNKLLAFRRDPNSETFLIADMNEIEPGIFIPNMPTDTDSDTDTNTDTNTDTDTNTTDTSSVDSDTNTTEAIHYLELRKSIDYIALAENGETAIINHLKKNGDPTLKGLSVEERIDRSYGYTLVRPNTFDLKMQLTDVPFNGIVTIPDQDIAYLLFSKTGSDAIKEVHKIHLKDFVVENPIKLESHPVSAGYIAGQNKIFINQEHPEGRLTFVDVTSGKTETVTGFILNSKIKD